MDLHQSACNILPQILISRPLHKDRARMFCKMGLSKRGMSISQGYPGSQEYNDMLRSSSDPQQPKMVEDSILKNHAIQISNMMKNAPMNAVPIKLALESYRSAIGKIYAAKGRTIHCSDKWILDNQLKICEPLQPHKKNGRWYVNGNALELMDWSITDKSRFLNWWEPSDRYFLKSASAV
jgi:hypothetical protein